MRSPPGPTPLPSPLSTQSTARRHAASVLPACFNLLRGNDGDLVMPKLDFQGREHSRLYRPELGIALQNELRALADIECIYEEQRDGLERSALPPSIKEHLANQLEERRASSRSPHGLSRSLRAFSSSCSP